MTFIIIFGIALFVFVTLLTEKEQGTWATILILASIALIFAIYHWEPAKTVWVFIQHNIFMLILAILSYVVIGVTWSIPKWIWFVQKTYQKQLAEYNSDLVNKYSNPSKPKLIVVNDNKVHIIRWMSYWPCSMFWWVVNEPITRLYNWCLYKMTGFYTKISIKIFDKLPK